MITGKEVNMRNTEVHSEYFCNTISEHSGLGSRYAYLSMEDFVITNPEQKKVKSFIENYINKPNKQKDNVIFAGNRGTGKTFASAIIARELLKQKHIDEFAYVPLHKFMSECKNSFDDKSFNALAYYSNIEFLVLDEVGSYILTPYDHQLLFNLIDTRYANILKTILVTNMPNLRDLFHFLQPSVADRVAESMEYINFGEKSLRNDFMMF